MAKKQTKGTLLQPKAVQKWRCIVPGKPDQTVKANTKVEARTALKALLGVGRLPAGCSLYEIS